MNCFEKWARSFGTWEKISKCSKMLLEKRDYNKILLLLEFISYDEFPIFQKFCIAILMDILMKQNDEDLLDRMIKMGAIPLFIKLSYSYSSSDNYNVLYILKLFTFNMFYIKR